MGGPQQNLAKRDIYIYIHINIYLSIYMCYIYICICIYIYMYIHICMQPLQASGVLKFWVFSLDSGFLPDVKRFLLDKERQGLKRVERIEQ